MFFNNLILFLFLFLGLIIQNRKHTKALATGQSRNVLFLPSYVLIKLSKFSVFVADNFESISYCCTLVIIFMKFRI